MKKLLWALGCLVILGGCAVHAEEQPDTLSGIVIESSEDSAVIEVEESSSDREDGWQSGGRFEIRDSGDLILFDGEETAGLGALKKDDRVMITFNGRKTVMHRMDEEEISGQSCDSENTHH